MANDPEYSDIQSDEDLLELNVALKEASGIAHILRTHKSVPVELRVAAFKIELEAQETLAFTMSSDLSEIQQKQKEPKEVPGIKYKTKRKGEPAKGIIEFTRAVKKEPKYSNIEFKCIGDYEKCQRKRGKRSVLCALAFFICMGRRIMPFVRQTT
jgi:hypothetical protein